MQNTANQAGVLSQVTSNLDLYRNPLLFIEFYFECNRIEVTADLEIKQTGDNKKLDIEAVTNQMWQTYRDLKEKTLIPYLIKEADRNDKKPSLPIFFQFQEFTRNLPTYLKKKRAELLTRAAASIKFSGTEDLSHLRNALSCILEKDDPNINTYANVMAHFINQVRTKMVHGPEKVKNHQMPVFRSGQNAGKTTFVKKFLSPVNDFTAELAFNQITDDRNFFVMENNFVVFIDELAGASRTEINQLKSIQTASKKHVRTLNTNRVTPVAQNSTFIGCTNDPLASIISDKTGMRRYFEIVCRNSRFD